MRWFPLVTFWQVTLDIPFAVGVPDGHGHRYTTGSVDAWRPSADRRAGPARTRIVWNSSSPRMRETRAFSLTRL
jgi:uncharacterized membrane protein